VSVFERKRTIRRFTQRFVCPDTLFAWLRPARARARCLPARSVMAQT
jgi:hypothetical protein